MGRRTAEIGVSYQSSAEKGRHGRDRSGNSGAMVPPEPGGKVVAVRMTEDMVAAAAEDGGRG